MKKPRSVSQKKWFIGVGLGLLVLGSVALVTRYKSSTGGIDAFMQGEKTAKTLQPSPDSVQLGKKLLENSKGSVLSVERETAKHISFFMDDPAFSLFFYKTLSFFGNTPGAYPAARFVALSMIYDSSPIHFNAMMWTIKEMRLHSQDLYFVLDKKSSQFDSNPYFHSRMLNLVHQLKVSSREKLDIYRRTIEMPLSVKSDGSLEDGSLALETALTLARNDAKSSSHNKEIVAGLSQALRVNTSHTQYEALRTRALTYFPNLSYLF